MRKRLVIVSLAILYASHAISREVGLQEPPAGVECFYEIATQYNGQMPELWNGLSPEERVFAYYMTRASIPGNRIAADQKHRDAVEIIDHFHAIMENKEQIKEQCRHAMDVEQFIKDAELYATYVYANQGQYFVREFKDHKRTPANLKLEALTSENLARALQAIGVEQAPAVVDRLHASIFDASHEPTEVVEGSIEQSACNYYSRDFTQADFESLTPEQKSALNNYGYIDHSDGNRVVKVQTHKIGGRYSKELEVAHHWLHKAHEHAQKYPERFDEHIPKSLAHMIAYLESGNEEDFKEFSKEWLRTKSRIDFNFGFVETYSDPMQYRGSFEADVTIKAVDMSALNALLPTLERQLPFPEEFKRQNLDDTSAIPNASVNAKVFASGDAGPVKRVAAYCLPNYKEIRAQLGSKQIMYQPGKGLGELVNPELSRNLAYIREQSDWVKKHDGDTRLARDLYDMHVVLHETLGHGSGRSTKHTFVEGDPLTIGGVTYKVGDAIDVTSENLTEFHGKYVSAFEELRAEILALYTSLYNFDELAAGGLYKDWPQKLSKQELQEWVLIRMGYMGLGRLLTQTDDATEIVQAHARADTAILNYLIDHGGLELVEEIYQVNGKSHTVVGVRVADFGKALAAVKDMAYEVQRCTSTADGLGVEKIMKTYGVCVRHPEYIKILKANRQAVQGDLKEIAEIYPRLTPIKDANNNVVDVAAEWPKSFLEQHMEFHNLTFSKE
jgi:dipeptidyl-peptidase III